MKRYLFACLLFFAAVITPGGIIKAQSNLQKLLKQSYNLVPAAAKDTQYFEMESRLQKHAPDGSILGTDVYRLVLRCVPSRDLSTGDEYTCLRFTVQAGAAPIAEVPSLVNWHYNFSLAAGNAEPAGNMFGIDRQRFEDLRDDKGNLFPLEYKYHVYNAFIDFHTMNVFADRDPKDSGVQHLRYIGDTIMHSASFSQPMVNLGTEVAAGSYFKNGKIMLAFKGIAAVNGKSCAILGYDSGKSSFYMMMKPTPGMEVPTKGSSHYWGDIFKDLGGGWIQEAVLHELVISETTVNGMANKIHSVIERTIVIRNIKKAGL